MRKLLLFFAACAAVLGVRAAEVGEYFTSGDLRYMVESVEPPVAALVSSENEKPYEGDITIPATVAHDNVTYKVSLPGGASFGAVTSVTFEPEFSGYLYMTLRSPALERLTLPKKVDPKRNVIVIYAQCPMYDVTMDREGDNIILNPRKLEVYRWDGGRASFRLAPWVIYEAPEIYPGTDKRMSVPVKDAFKYGLENPDTQYGFLPVFKFATDNSTHDQAVNIQLRIPEDYSGVTTTDGLLDYSIVGGKAVVKGFVENKKEGVESLAIPGSIKYEGKNVPVTKIGVSAFQNADLRTIDLGSVEEIAAFAVYGNMNLEEVYLPATLKKVGTNAFWGAKCIKVDPAAKIESDNGFHGNEIMSISSLQIEGETATLRLHCAVYKNGKPVELYLTRKDYNSNAPDIMPDENGTFTIDKDWLVDEHPYEAGSYYYSGDFNVKSTDPCIEGRLSILSIGERFWTTQPTDPAEHIYIIGDVTAWAEPNNPESGIKSGNAFREPSMKNADFYEAYKMPLLDKGSQLYAGNFYLPATEAVHSGAVGPNYTTQFRFITALTGWDTPQHVGADVLNFFTVVRELDMYGHNAYMGGLSNWGIECYETTPVTVVVDLSEYPSIWVKKGHYDVLPSYGWVVEPIFIAKNAGAAEAVTDAVDEDAPVEWYNLQGMRVTEPVHGIYILRQGTCTTKVLVR